MGSRPGSGRPLVDDWACLRAMVDTWTAMCGPMDQYAMRHTRFFSNLCNSGVLPQQLGEALGASGVCGAREAAIAVA